MLPRFLDLYETLTTFYHAFVTKWLKQDDPMEETNGKVMEFVQFIRDTLNVFINAN